MRRVKWKVKYRAVHTNDLFERVHAMAKIGEYDPEAWKELEIRFFAIFEKIVPLKERDLRRRLSEKSFALRTLRRENVLLAIDVANETTINKRLRMTMLAMEDQLRAVITSEEMRRPSMN